MTKTITKAIILSALAVAIAGCRQETKPPERDDRAILRDERNALEIGFASGEDIHSVKSDLKLPLEGIHGATISWESGAPDIISDSGEVIRPQCYNRPVELTARIEYGERRVFQPFRLTVIKEDIGKPRTGYSRTITVDGKINDTQWNFSETRFKSSSGEHGTAFISWDDDYLYIGYKGEDIPSSTQSAGQKWFNVYIGIDCSGDGSYTAQQFRNQHFKLPFKANYAIKWRPSDFFVNSAPYENNSWRYTLSQTLPFYNPLNTTRETSKRVDDELEMKIARKSFGDPEKINLLIFLLCEEVGNESTWGIVPHNSAKDGFEGINKTKEFKTFLHIDFASKNPPAKQAIKSGN
jgi:hypothetical protein